MADPARPLLSICMIVKNEEAVLERALASTAGMGPEVIVVDTGSTDRTVAIAEAFGASVHHFPWLSDFAAARNFAFACATGTWLFVLDADEVLAPDFGSASPTWCGTRRLPRSGSLRRRSTTAAASTPILQAVSVSAGATHTCAVVAAGELVCWGSNGNGELGTSPAVLPSSSRPVRVALPTRAKSVSAGNKLTCALLDDGKVFCWGNNDAAQLARSPFSSLGDPREVPVPPTDARGVWSPVTAVTAGGSHACVTSVNGPSPIAGKDLNYTWCWGKNLSRQLQRDTNGFPSVVPLIATQNGKEADTFGFFVDRVAAGADYTCAESFIPVPSGVFFRGIVCWGAAGSNQIGKSAGADQPLAFPSYGSDGFLNTPRLLATGGEHACTIAAAAAGGESLYCWGKATKGAIGSVATTAADGKVNLVAGVDGAKVTHVAAGGETTCIVSSGTFRCMGANSSGQLGNGTVDALPHPQLSTVELPPTVSSVSVGGEHACVVLGGAAGRSGEVRCWGANRAGQLGDGLDLATGYPGDLGQKYLRSKPVPVLAP